MPGSSTQEMAKDWNQEALVQNRPSLAFSPRLWKGKDFISLTLPPHCEAPANPNAYSLLSAMKGQEKGWIMGRRDNVGLLHTVLRKKPSDRI